MYPFFRLALQSLRFRAAPRLDLTEPHVTTVTCWPWDLDPWRELNNGRTLTLYDLGRIPMAQRSGLVAAAGRMGWGLTVAGNTTRYRRRVRAFDRLRLHSRCIGWDARFLYIEQSMWRGDECTSHILIRSAVTSARGIVAPERVLAAMGQPAESPPLPAWVTAWIAAEAARPWPPALA